MSSSLPPVVIHQTAPGNTAQSAVTPTLSGMPPEITDHILRFTPDSIRICRAVFRAFREIGEGILEEHAQSIHGFCSGTDSSLYSLIQDRFANFRHHYQSNPNCSYLEFHLSVPTNIALLGVPCRSRILALQEIAQYNNKVQSLQDVNLQRIWEPLRQQILAAGPQPEGIPDVNASPQEIRSWVRLDANQPALQRITHLRLTGLRLTCVPLEIRLCAGLQKLDLSNNRLTSLPEGLFQGLTGLQQLNLRNNQLIFLPEGLFQELAGLQGLNLGDNQLTFLPEGLFQGLTGLQMLSLCRNRLTSLPEGLFQELTGLEWLSLSSNQLNTLPKRLFQRLAGLQRLDLGSNQLATLPEALFQGLARLQRLDLNTNQLATLPEALFQGLVRLRGLHLFVNQLATLPEGLFQGLIGLENLGLSNIELTTLPEGVFRGLMGLQSLSLSKNQLTSLPEGLFQELAGLQHLFLYSNRLSSLPEALFRGLARLQELHLYGNPRLLFFHQDLPNHENSIGFLETIQTFFSYPCTSPLAQVYQLVAGDASPEAVGGPFSQVPVNIRDAIFEKVWEEAGRPNTEDPKWGEHHAFDNMQIFGAALKRYVCKSFETQAFASNNILVLIDDMMRCNNHKRKDLQ